MIAICLIGECLGWDVETELLSHMQAHRDKFPILPGQSRFNRRRRQLQFVINRIRQMLLARIDLSQDGHCVIDSLPIPVVQFHLAPYARGDWPAHGADFGKVPSRKETIFGYKLHLLTTASGLILDFELAPASVSIASGWGSISHLLPPNSSASVSRPKARCSTTSYTAKTFLDAPTWARSPITGHRSILCSGYRKASATAVGSHFHFAISRSITSSHALAAGQTTKTTYNCYVPPATASKVIVRTRN